jgi:hypothetical protein
VLRRAYQGPPSFRDKRAPKQAFETSENPVCWNITDISTSCIAVSLYRPWANLSSTLHKIKMAELSPEREFSLLSLLPAFFHIGKIDLLASYLFRH